MHPFKIRINMISRIEMFLAVFQGIPEKEDRGPRTEDLGPRTQDPGPRTQDHIDIWAYKKN